MRGQPTRAPTARASSGWSQVMSSQTGFVLSTIAHGQAARQYDQCDSDAPGPSAQSPDGHDTDRQDALAPSRQQRGSASYQRERAGQHGACDELPEVVHGLRTCQPAAQRASCTPIDPQASSRAPRRSLVMQGDRQQEVHHEHSRANLRDRKQL